MRRLSKTTLILTAIVILGLFLRVFQVAENPVGLHGDEASIGYNAYSLLKTGRDQNGKFLPLAIDQFGDFRPAGYHYLDIPFVAVLGLNALAVRLPAALFGTASIIVFFFLMRLLVKKEGAALLASLFLAVSPWHITISRATSESVIALFFVLVGTLLWMSAWEKKQNHIVSIVLGALSFIISFLFYHAARVFVPLMLIPLAGMTFFSLKQQFRKSELFPFIKKTLVFIVVILLSLLLILKGSQGLDRPGSVSILNIPGGWQGIIQQQSGEDGIQNPLITRAFHNKLYTLGRFFLTSYFTHYTGEFFFLSNGNPVRYRVPWMGVLQYTDMILLPIGLAVLLLELIRKKNMVALFFLSWFAIGGVPSGLTWEDLPNIQRASFMIPGMLAISTYGAMELVNGSKRYRYVIIAVLSAITIGSFLYFFHMYFHHGKTHEPWHRSAAEAELVFALEKITQTAPVVMTTSGNNNLIFHLFYRKFDPAKFQAMGSPKEEERLVFLGMKLTGNPCPMGNTISEVDGDLSTVFVSEYSCKKPKNAEILQTIYYPDGSGVFTLMRLTSLPVK